MKSLKRGLGIVCATSILSGFGCGAAGEPEETVAQVQEAINVSTWNGLVGMATTGTYVLTADIDAAGRTWTPKAFRGTFDGGGFTIRNLTINGGSFFSGLTNATVERVRFTNLRLTGSIFGEIGGLASYAENSIIRNCSVEADIDVAAVSVGGLVGAMSGGSIYRSYAMGTMNGNILYGGGLVGTARKAGSVRASIIESYAQMVINLNTSVQLAAAGGLVGQAHSTIIYDVYALGNVTGRAGVGGIVGIQQCTSGSSFFELYKTIYRGDVVDANLSSSGGWAGAVGTFQNCIARFEQNFYDRTLDPSSGRANHPSIQGYTTTELRSPTSVIGGVFCAPDTTPGRCGDNSWTSPPWTAGTNTQHHVLMNMPGPNSQPR